MWGIQMQNLRRIVTIPISGATVRELYSFPGVAEKPVNMQHIQRGIYYQSHPTIKPVRLRCRRAFDSTDVAASGAVTTLDPVFDLLVDLLELGDIFSSEVSQ